LYRTFQTASLPENVEEFKDVIKRGGMEEASVNPMTGRPGRARSAKRSKNPEE